MAKRKKKNKKRRKSKKRKKKNKKFKRKIKKKLKRRKNYESTELIFKVSKKWANNGCWKNT